MITPIQGEIYTIRNIVAWPDGLGFRLEEIVNFEVFAEFGLTEPAFLSERFRPVDMQFGESVINSISEMEDMETVSVIAGHYLNNSKLLQGTLEVSSRN